MHDVDALEVVVDRLLAHLGIGVGQGTELVVVVLEGVRIDGPEPHPEVSACGAAARVVDQVPGDVQRDEGSEPGAAGGRWAASATFSWTVAGGARECSNTLNLVPELP